MRSDVARGPRRHRWDYPPFEAALCELVGLVCGLGVGGVVGQQRFGRVGLIVGAFVGATVGPLAVRLPRLRREFVTIWDVFEAFGLSGGLMFGVGFAFASPSAGWLSRIAVLILALLVGWFGGWLPSFVTEWSIRRGLAKETTDALRARLKDPNRWLQYRLVMDELQRRGEDVRSELAVVVSLLSGDSPERRFNGLRMLRMFFPDLAREIPDYHPSQGRAACQAQAESIGTP